jgi:hypothetical protein
VTEKRLTVILYGCDRNLWSGGPLQIGVADLFASVGRGLCTRSDGRVTLELRADCPSMPARCTASRSPPDHRPAWQLVRRLDFPVRNKSRATT